MRNLTRVRQLTTEAQTVLLKGTKSPMGFTVRRRPVLLLRAEGFTRQQSGQRLHCGDQTVGHVIRAFEREGVGCLQEKSHRPHRDYRVFAMEGLGRLHELVHRSPRDFGLETSRWTLPLLARIGFEPGMVTRAVG